MKIGGKLIQVIIWMEKKASNSGVVKWRKSSGNDYQSSQFACSADEMDPGSCKMKMIINHFPLREMRSKCSRTVPQNSSFYEK